MHTESQALELLCPVMTHGSDVHLCAGSLCAAWRWTSDRKSDQFEAPNTLAVTVEESGAPEKYRHWLFEPHNAAKNQPATFFEPPAQLDARSVGVCGLIANLPPIVHVNAPLLLAAQAVSTQPTHPLNERN